MYMEAEKRAKAQGRIRHSFLRGRGTLPGYIGESIVEKALKVIRRNTYDYDFLLPNGDTVDVKTSRCAVTPTKKHECSVATSSIHQRCHYYIFVKIHKSLKYGWIVGTISKKSFFSLATLRKRGSIHPVTRKRVKADSFSLPIALLSKIKG